MPSMQPRASSQRPKLPSSWEPAKLSSQGTTKRLPSARCVSWSSEPLPPSAQSQPPAPSRPLRITRKSQSRASKLSACREWKKLKKSGTSSSVMAAEL